MSLPVRNLNFAEFDFWALPFEKYGLFLATELDTYGFAASKVREALSGVGNRGVRKKRLIYALEQGDEATTCAEIASIFRSALADFPRIRGKKLAQICAVNPVLPVLDPQNDTKSQIEREKKFFFYYIDNFYLYRQSEWEAAA